MNVLMLTFDAGGNVPPFIRLGRELRSRGHQVRCLAQSSLQPAVEQAGLEFRPLRHGLPYTPLERLALSEQYALFGRLFYDDGYARDLEAEIERARPDATVVDCYLIAALTYCEAARLPYAILMHTLFGWMNRSGSAAPAGVNGVREGAGLAPVASIEEVWRRAGRTLVATSPLLDVPAPEMMPGLRYVGPLYDERPVGQVPSLAGSAADPLILISFSTTFMDQEPLIARAIGALRDLPVRVLVTHGPAVNPASLPPAANVTVAAWAPHAAVLPMAAMVITHGGHGTVSMALAHGVPLICLPLGRDQEYIAERVRAIGAGIPLSRDADEPAMRAAVRTMLDDHSYRDAAQRVGAAIRAEGPVASKAAEELEALARK